MNSTEQVSLTMTSMTGFEIMEKIIAKRFNKSVARHFFPIKIAIPWNALPYDVVNSMTANTFKNRLDAHWEDNPPRCAGQLVTLMTRLSTMY